jgi:putative transposase
MERENIGEKNINYCRKVRFYPTYKHKLLLEKCFGATRYIINWALQENKNRKIENITNPISVRNHLRYQNKYLTNENKWLQDIPYDTRDLAIRQLCSNFKTAFTQLKNKTISSFDMKFKSKKNPVQMCFITKKAFSLKKKTLFVRKIKEPISFDENIDDFEYGNITIVREKNRYYMCFPLKRPITNINTKFKVVSLDPGVRTFQTFYSEEGICGKIGNNICKHLKTIYHKEDKLKSFLSTNKVSKKTRYNIRKRCFLLRTKVKNTVKDLHRKTCSWLTNNFKHVYLPSFEVKPMIRKCKRKIPTSCVRSMLALSHYSFKERLLFTSRSKNCKVHIVSEAWTSKTCGNCGFINKNLRSSNL